MAGSRTVWNPPKLGTNPEEWSGEEMSEAKRLEHDMTMRMSVLGEDG